MADLTYGEVKAVAELKYHGGYNILLGALQAHIDDLANDLATATPDSQISILGQWRAARSIFGILKYTPESYAVHLLELNPDPNQVELEAETPRGTLSPAEETKLQNDFTKAGGKIQIKV